MTQVYHWFSQKITHRAFKNALNILPMVCMGALAFAFSLNKTSFIQVDYLPE